MGPYLVLNPYLEHLPLKEIVIIKKDYTPNPTFALSTLKAISKQLCVSTLRQIASYFILVRKSLVMEMFGCGFRGKVPSHIGIAK